MHCPQPWPPSLWLGWGFPSQAIQLLCLVAGKSSVKETPHSDGTVLTARPHLGPPLPTCSSTGTLDTHDKLDPWMKFDRIE